MAYAKDGGALIAQAFKKLDSTASDDRDAAVELLILGVRRLLDGARSDTDLKRQQTVIARAAQYLAKGEAVERELSSAAHQATTATHVGPPPGEGYAPLVQPTPPFPMGGPPAASPASTPPYYNSAPPGDFGQAMQPPMQQPPSQLVNVDDGGFPTAPPTASAPGGSLGNATAPWSYPPPPADMGSPYGGGATGYDTPGMLQPYSATPPQIPTAPKPTAPAASAPFQSPAASAPFQSPAASAPFQAPAAAAPFQSPAAAAPFQSPGGFDNGNYSGGDNNGASGYTSAPVDAQPVSRPLIVRTPPVERRTSTQGKIPMIEITLGDITEQSTDTIVNAANGRLKLGSGIAGAIRRKGGTSIQTECDWWCRSHGTVPDGEVAITTAGSLPCKKVIHAVGPMAARSGPPTPEMQQKLRSAVLNSLAAAEKEGFESICIPAISSGVFGYPKDQATAEIYAACAAYRGNVRVIRLISIDEETVAAFKRARDTYNTAQMPGGPGVPPPNYSATPTSTDGPYPHSEHPF